jgi:hypothetical protein
LSGAAAGRAVAGGPAASSGKRWADGAIAAAAVLCYAGHAGGYYVRVGQPAGALWACHIGTLLIALGAALRAPRLNAVGVSWLALGTPVWLLDLSTGAGLIPTSLLTHVGGTALGCVGVARMGFPRGTWWRALAGIVALQQVTRLVAPPSGNVNVAFIIHPGWEAHFSSYGRYWLAMTLLTGVVFAAAEVVFRLLARATGRGGATAGV